MTPTPPWMDVPWLELQQRLSFLNDLARQLPTYLADPGLPVWPYQVMLVEIAEVERLTRYLLAETLKARLYHNHPDRTDRIAATPCEGMCGRDDST